jgi:hypothetical protein
MSSKVKVTSLTKAQEKKLHLYKNEAIELGLSMKRINVEQATKVIQALTNTSGQKVSVYSSPMDVITKYKDRPESTRPTYSNAFLAEDNAAWLAHYSFYTKECGIVDPEGYIARAKEVLRECHWFWVSSDEIFIVERPQKMELKPTGTLLRDDATGETMNLQVLHSTEGKSVEYADGFGVYAIGGIRLPKEYYYIVDNWKTLSAKDLLKIENVEIRQAAMAAFGPNVYEALPHTIDDTWVSMRGGIYHLFNIQYETGLNRKYLKGACPSKGDDFFEPVPREVTSCQQALQWRENRTLEGKYVEPLIRT